MVQTDPRCPHRGSLCVQLAYITVFYVLEKLVYSNQELMRQASSVKRYIDDGAGQFTGSTRQFSTWIKKVNEAIAQYGLEIDEFHVENTGDFVSFLDVKYTFDEQGNLQTDLHKKYKISERKPTLLISGFPSQKFTDRTTFIWNTISPKLKLDDFSYKTSSIESAIKKALFRNQHMDASTEWTSKDYDLTKVTFTV